MTLALAQLVVVVCSSDNHNYMELSNIEDILDNTEDDEEITNMRELTEDQMWGFFIEGFLLVSFLLQITFSHE